VGASWSSIQDAQLSDTCKCCLRVRVASTSLHAACNCAFTNACALVLLRSLARFHCTGTHAVLLCAFLGHTHAHRIHSHALHLTCARAQCDVQSAMCGVTTHALSLRCSAVWCSHVDVCLLAAQSIFLQILSLASLPASHRAQHRHTASAVQISSACMWPPMLTC
jgi:hypothetical protein